MDTLREDLRERRKQGRGETKKEETGGDPQLTPHRFDRRYILYLTSEFGPQVRQRGFHPKQ